MKIYAAGWALQSPALNFFKQFLRLNAISISGIVYPRKIPDDLDDIPVLDFAEARQAVSPDDMVLECHRPGAADLRLGMDLKAFFDSLGVKTTSTTDFIVSLIRQDQQNSLKFPVPGLTSQDIRELWNEAPFNFIDDGFADLESYTVGSRLDEISRAADWDRMLAFDQDDTVDNVLFNVIEDLFARGICQDFHVLNTPRPFLNALLKLKTRYPEAALPVEVNETAINELGTHLEFYRRSLGFTTATADDRRRTTYLAGSLDTVAQRLPPGQPAGAIFFMQRSIVDYRKLQRTLGTASHRVLLRQPDTMPAHLIAALLTQ